MQASALYNGNRVQVVDTLIDDYSTMYCELSDGKWVPLDDLNQVQWIVEAEVVRE